MQVTSLAINWSERGLVPDYAIRAGIRRLVEKRLQEISADDCEAGAVTENAFIEKMDKSPVAPVPELANAQHYEVPAEFFHLCLGRHRKYSSCYWAEDTRTLDEAEALALKLTCEHATLAELVNRLHALRREYGREREPFEVHAISIDPTVLDASTGDGLRRLEEIGVTHAIVSFHNPYEKTPRTLAQKLDEIRGYGDAVIAKQR